MKNSLKILVIFSILFALYAGQAVALWGAPSVSPPPDNNTEPPIDISSVSQTKFGNLGLNKQGTEFTLQARRANLSLGNSVAGGSTLTLVPGVVVWQGGAPSIEVGTRADETKNGLNVENLVKSSSFCLIAGQPQCISDWGVLGSRRIGEAKENRIVKWVSNNNVGFSDLEEEAGPTGVIKAHRPIKEVNVNSAGLQFNPSLSAPLASSPATTKVLSLDQAGNVILVTAACPSVPPPASTPPPPPPPPPPPAVSVPSPVFTYDFDTNVARGVSSEWQVSLRDLPTLRGRSGMFLSSESYVHVNRSPLLSLPTSAMSIEAWFKLPDDPNGVGFYTNKSRIVSNTEGGGFQLSFTFNEPSNVVCGSNKLCFLAYINRVYKAVAIPVDTALKAELFNTAKKGGWRHIVGTYDGSSLKLYLDGIQRGANTSASGSISYHSTAPFCIGNEAAGNRCGGPNNYMGFGAGQIDEVKIYDSALTPAQIQANYNSLPQ